MKSTLLLTSVFAVSTTFAHLHEPGFSLNVDTYDKADCFISLFHQSTFALEDGNFLFMHTVANPYFDKTFHSELGIGYRKFTKEWGFGTNFVLATSNRFGFFNHQFCPGLELFWKNVKVAFNSYIPLKTNVELPKSLFTFHLVSELDISYSLFGKYELGLNPYFNHSNSSMGFGAYATVPLLKDWMVTLNPYYDSKEEKGLCFSLTYRLGPSNAKEASRVKKNSRFFYAREKIDPSTKPVYVPTMPEVEIAKPINIGQSSNDDPKPVPAWWEKLFFFRL